MFGLLRRLLTGSAQRDAAAEAADIGASDRGSALTEVGALRAAGRNREAMDVVVRALGRDRADASLLLEQAELLLERDRAHEALAVLAHVELSGMRDPRVDRCAASACLQRGDAPAAETQYRRALAAEPENGDVRHGLGMALFAQRRFGEAAACFRQSRERMPADVRQPIMLGRCLLEQRDPVAAEEYLRAAVVLDDTSSAAWRHLASALDRQDRSDEALAAWERATLLEDAAGEGESFAPFAVALTDRGRIAEALAVLERWLPRVPLVDGHFAYAIALLTAGRLAEGWDHYEFRWLREPLLSTRAGSERPAWTGQDVRDKTILLRIEQGYGDTFQFLRYARLVKALGARVLLKRFDDVVAGVSGVDLLGDDGPAPAHDYYVNLLSLPRVFATTLASIPADIPYLTVSAERMARWAARIGAHAGEFKVGLVWAGGAGHARDRFRSIAPEALVPLCTVPGVRWYSLQKGTAAMPPGVEDLGSALRDFADTAAVIAQLDLVICVDTSVTHLAGALGKAVWVLLPVPADWRWLEGRDNSPWYPTARIFRQRERGDWADVVGRVKAALAETLRGDGATQRARTTAEVAVHEFTPVSRPGPGAGHRHGMSAVAETRHGIVQYLPDAGDEGLSIAWYGEWLEPQVEVLARLLQRDSTVLEVGAGVGSHAVWLGNVLGTAGHLVVCEPRAVQQRILRQNLAANRIANATLLRDALGGPGVDNGTVDGLRLERLHWIKVGAAADAAAVLAGASDTLWRLRPMLWLAADDVTAVTRLADLATAHGYRCWRHQAALFNAANFNRRNGDVFAGRAACALFAVPEETDVDVALPDCVALS